jgi:hypothetical protein
MRRRGPSAASGPGRIFPKTGVAGYPASGSPSVGPAPAPSANVYLRQQTSLPDGTPVTRYFIQLANTNTMSEFLIYNDLLGYVHVECRFSPDIDNRTYSSIKTSFEGAIPWVDIPPV